MTHIGDAERRVGWRQVEDRPDVVPAAHVVPRAVAAALGIEGAQIGHRAAARGRDRVLPQVGRCTVGALAAHQAIAQRERIELAGGLQRGQDRLVRPPVRADLEDGKLGADERGDLRRLLRRLRRAHRGAECGVSLAREADIDGSVAELACGLPACHDPATHAAEVVCRKDQQ